MKLAGSGNMGMNPYQTISKEVLKKELRIPRLELVSAHMASNLVAKVKDALQYQPIRSVSWMDG